MDTHLLQSEIWEKYEKLEGKTTFRLTGNNFNCLVTKSSTPFGNYLYLPYGPALFSSPENTFPQQNQTFPQQNQTFPQPNSTFPQPDQTSQKSTLTTSTYSPLLDISTAKSSLTDALKALLSLAKTEKANFVRIEPIYNFSEDTIASCAKKAGFKAIKKSKELDPEHTWVLDLTSPETKILKNMESRKVRYWRNYAKKGMSIRTTKNPDEISILTNFLKNLGEKDNFTPQTENHLKNQLKSGFATLYIVELSAETSNQSTKTAETPSKNTVSDKKSELSAETPSKNTISDKKSELSTKTPIPIAAALVYDYKKVRYYAHAATDFEHRKLQAGSILLIQMILDAKNNGQKFYDFWGITKSEDKNHPWYYFTQYKKSFGGFEVKYSGTYDLILNPKKYHLYELARKINRNLRKFR